jgi:hypothetical protein
MTDVWQESVKSFKYFKVQDNESFWVYTFLVFLLMLDEYWLILGKGKDKHEKDKKRV